MKTRRHLLYGIVLGSLTRFLQAEDKTFGHFSGAVQTEWLHDGRWMELLAPVLYTDPDGVQWLAKAGLKTDGATIPPFAWPFIGGPFEGKYRDAAVIHDAACCDKNRHWESVHLAFYNAMRCKEVEVWRAKVMYAAVYFFGPRWVLNPLEELPKRVFASEADFFAFAARIESGETKEPPEGTNAAFRSYCKAEGSNVIEALEKQLACVAEQVDKAVKPLSTSKTKAASLPQLSLEDIRSFRP
jgi:Protein of unknown function (DUF1353)